MKQVGILFGGRSPEHEISIRSTEAILANLDRESYTPHLFPVDRNGTLFRGDGGVRFLKEGVKDDIVPATYDQLREMDVVFPVFHGPYGEDGTVQGLLAFLGVPFVGCGVESSALNMHKGLFRDVMKSHAIPQPDYLYFGRTGQAGMMDQIQKCFPLPVFVKPCRGGSSIGISRVDDWDQLEEAIAEAFRFDDHVIIEEGIPITEELEVSVLGTPDAMTISPPGKLIAGDVFYTYKDKYVDTRTRFEIPAQDLPVDVSETVREMSGRAYTLTNCFGLARVDFLYSRDSGHLLLNEINTMPGFTEISMYPKLMISTGLSFSELVTQLIEMAGKRTGT